MGLFDFIGNAINGVTGMLGKVPFVGGIANAVGKVASGAAHFVGHIFGEKGSQASHAIKRGINTAQQTYEKVGQVGQAIGQLPIIGDRAREMYRNSGLQNAYSQVGEGLGRGREIYDQAEKARMQGASVYKDVMRDPVGAGMRYGERFMRRSGY